MNDFSLVDKLRILMNIIVSSPLFLSCSMLAIAVLIFFIICLKKDKKINKWMFVGIWAILGIILLISYNSILLKLFDNLFDNLFMALYFPNLTIYLIIIIVSNFFFIYSIFDKKMKKSHKFVNIVSAIIINVFLIVIIDTVKRNGISITDTLNLYTNSNLLVLLELTSAVFTSWLLLNLLITAYHKLQIYDKKEYPVMQEIIFDE